MVDVTQIDREAAVGTLSVSLECHIFEKYGLTLTAEQGCELAEIAFDFLVPPNRQAAVAAERERCVEAVEQLLSTRAAFYENKASQNDPFANERFNRHEYFKFGAEVCSYTLGLLDGAINSEGSDNGR